VEHIYVSNKAWHLSRTLISQTVALQRIDHCILVCFGNILLPAIDLITCKTSPET
jgi:hypothetical protein